MATDSAAWQHSQHQLTPPLTAHWRPAGGSSRQQYGPAKVATVEHAADADSCSAPVAARQAGVAAGGAARRSGQELGRHRVAARIVRVVKVQHPVVDATAGPAAEAAPHLQAQHNCCCELQRIQR